jgi:hypothetical protein
MGWAILYEDGSWFTDRDGAYWQAPRYGVQAVLRDDAEVGVRLLSSLDGWWVWKFGSWVETDERGADAYRLNHRHPEHCTLNGPMVPDDRWREIQKMVEDRKSAWHPLERRVTDG